MENIQGNTIILDGKLTDVSAYDPETSAGMFYEVIRVMKGRLLFLEDHIERLRSSCEQAGVTGPGNQLIREQVNHLVNYLSIKEGNVKPVIFRNWGEWHLCCYQVPHSYPTEKDYLFGVKTKTFSFERPDPTIKRWNDNFRNKVNAFIKEENIYEAILLNEQGKLTEGSRSNLFFLDHKGRIITAPKNFILPGITRKYVLQICGTLNIEAIETIISLEEAKLMSACFITGTSPKVLPVSQMDQITFDVTNPTVHRIMDQFQKLIKKQLND